MSLLKKMPKGKIWKKQIAPNVVVTKMRAPAEETLFPEKLQKAREILSHTRLLSSEVGLEV